MCSTQEYIKTKIVKEIPRIPLEGYIDLTYRCNNNCRHCWLWLPENSEEKAREFSFDEIRNIVKDARSMGCRRWSISGGEPMLREDFPEIFDYITSKSSFYSINTNGSLITPEIAMLMKKKGWKKISIYGATADVYDHITRNPGSFEAAMQGFAYLKEAGAEFTVQIFPMRDNYHQFKDMVRLAESLSPYWRIGAAWLHLSASGDPVKNAEIRQQRLSPKDVIELDKPALCFEEQMGKNENQGRSCATDGDDRLFASCIKARRDFHIDPYGKMTFCMHIKDPSLQYDLRKGSFAECWERFTPNITDMVKGGREYIENCGSCDMRRDCRYCPVFGYLEHGRFSSKVEYLCEVAKESRIFKEDWKKNHRRYYPIAGITIQVDSDLPITENTFDKKFKHFETAGPGQDNIFIRHHFSLPELDENLGKEVYRNPPWAIYKKGNSWIYLCISSDSGNNNLYKVATFNNDHTSAKIYSPDDSAFKKGNLHSLTLFSTDQILLARVLADRGGCYIHSSGVIFENKGLLFVGHSEAGKSTMVKMLKDEAEILCDDRVIVRRWHDGFKIHGTWSHGEVPDVSANSAPLDAILFLQKSDENLIVPIHDKKEIIKRLLPCLIRPMADTGWWDKMLCLIERMAQDVPCYTLYFDKSGGVKDLLREIITNKDAETFLRRQENEKSPNATPIAGPLLAAN